MSCLGWDSNMYMYMYLFRRNLLPQNTKEFRRHISRRTDRSRVQLHSAFRRHLTDTVVGKLQPHVARLFDPLASGDATGGKVPHEHIGRLHVLVDYLLHVEVLHATRNLGEIFFGKLERFHELNRI